MKSVYLPTLDTYVLIFDVLIPADTRASTKPTAQVMPSMMGTLNSFDNWVIKSAIPAQPNTIASALSSSKAARISDRISSGLSGSFPQI